MTHFIQKYKLSFIAAVEERYGKLKIVLKDLNGLRTIYDSQEETGSWVELTDTPNTYTFQYKHNSDTVMDVRLAFDFGGKKQIVYLDRVVFIRE